MTQPKGSTWPGWLLQPHGTMAAVRRHRRRRTALCAQCKDAEQRDSSGRYDAAARHARYLQTGK